MILKDEMLYCEFESKSEYYWTLLRNGSDERAQAVVLPSKGKTQKFIGHGIYVCVGHDGDGRRFTDSINVGQVHIPIVREFDISRIPENEKATIIEYLKNIDHHSDPIKVAEVLNILNTNGYCSYTVCCMKDELRQKLWLQLIA